MKHLFIIVFLLSLNKVQAQTCEQAVASLNHYYQEVASKYQHYATELEKGSDATKATQQKNLKFWYDKQIHYCLAQVKIIEKLCPSTLSLQEEPKDEEDLTPLEVAPEEAKKTIRFEIPSSPMGWKAQ
jgi:hypothetical protein